ncbi:hypothetical protein [Geitlerinema sp. PCC 7407]|uniref:hypothetical protein n=1 Tax=Geitlerinema sp. PCC 7407 TaxID=1173025 RepID=UPI0012378A20|nr:hypothetical protein [Geitlerinema sp. PCC 7407]
MNLREIGDRLEIRRHQARSLLGTLALETLPDYRAPSSGSMLCSIARCLSLIPQEAQLSGKVPTALGDRQGQDTRRSLSAL